MQMTTHPPDDNMSTVVNDNTPDVISALEEIGEEL